MKLIVILTLYLAFIGCAAAQEATAPTGPAPAPLAPEAQSAAPSREALEQAFDGALTCSALAAVKANQANKSEAWRWGNRSFAFGMLAVRFYTDATKKQLNNEEIDNKLTDYANTLIAMTPEQRKPFEEGCARKYAEIDKLCEINKCPHTAPGAPAAPGAARAGPAAPAQSAPATTP